MAKRKAVVNRSVQRPFVCEEPGCHRCFTRFDHLQRHALVHDEAALKLPCPDCGKTFLRHDMLVRHQRSVHDPNKAKRSKKSRSDSSTDEPSPAKKAKPATIVISSTSSLSSFDSHSGLLSSVPTNWSTPLSSATGLPPAGSAPPWRGDACADQTSSENMSPVSERSWSSTGVLWQNGGSLSWTAGLPNAAGAGAGAESNGGHGVSRIDGGFMPSRAMATPTGGTGTNGMIGDSRVPGLTDYMSAWGLLREGNAMLNGPVPGSMGTHAGLNPLTAQSLANSQFGANLGATPTSTMFGGSAHRPTASLPSLLNASIGPTLHAGSSSTSPSNLHFSSGTPTIYSHFHNSSSPMNHNLGWPLGWTMGRAAGTPIGVAGQTAQFGFRGSIDGDVSPETPVVPSSTEDPGWNGYVQCSLPSPSQHAWLLASGGAGEGPQSLSSQMNTSDAPDPGATATATRDMRSTGKADNDASSRADDNGIVAAQYYSLLSPAVAAVSPSGVEHSDGTGPMNSDSDAATSESCSPGQETPVSPPISIRLLSDKAPDSVVPPQLAPSPHTSIPESTRQHLLAFLSSVPELATSTLFTGTELQGYAALFFTKWNALLPMLHEPTFRPAETLPALLAAIVVIGMSFAASQPAAELAYAIANKLWAAIVSIDTFHPQLITLELLQAMVLLDVYCTLSATRPLHELADCFHPLVVNLARRNAIFDSGPPPSLRGDTRGAEATWQEWIAYEEKNRLAHMICILDVIHATLFRHRPSLCAVQKSLCLMADEARWRQPTAEAWAGGPTSSSYNGSVGETTGQTRLHASPKPHGDAQRLHVSTALKVFLSQTSPSSTHNGGTTSQPDSQTPLSKAPAYTQPFSRLSLFTTLTGLANELNQISSFTHDRHEGKGALQVMKEKVFAAMHRWREEERGVRSDHEATRLLSASMQVAGMLTLYADVMTIQAACEVNPLQGQYASAATVSASRAAVKSWTSRPEARAAALTALQGIDELLGSAPAKCDNGPATATDLTSADDALIRHRVLYMCAVVLFAYLRFGSFAATALPDDETAESPPKDAQQTRAFLVQARSWTEQSFATSQASQHLKGILTLVESGLSNARWELAREEASTLRRLRDTPPSS
ncbi:hypothetical protein V8E36_003332 [Tilletia maclaganii]